MVGLPYCSGGSDRDLERLRKEGVGGSDGIAGRYNDIAQGSHHSGSVVEDEVTAPTGGTQGHRITVDVLGRAKQNHPVTGGDLKVERAEVISTQHIVAITIREGGFTGLEAFIIDGPVKQGVRDHEIEGGTTTDVLNEDTEGDHVARIGINEVAIHKPGPERQLGCVAEVGNPVQVIRVDTAGAGIDIIGGGQREELVETVAIGEV